MRDKILYGFGIAAALLLVRNLYLIFLVMPDEASQGMVYRIMYFHIPAWWTAFIAMAMSVVTSVLMLSTGKLKYDALSVAATEIGVAFGVMGITLGSIWGRIIWGIWWTWDARLTSALICILLYASYLALRQAIDEPVKRAKISAAYSLFAFADVPIVWFSIRWWRTQHPPPMQLPPEMMATVLWNWLALVLVAVVFILIRVEQEDQLRTMQSLRFEVAAAVK